MDNWPVLEAWEEARRLVLEGDALLGLSSVVSLLFDPADDLVQEFQAVTTESYFDTSIVEDLPRFAASLALECQAITIHFPSDGFIGSIAIALTCDWWSSHRRS